MLQKQAKGEDIIDTSTNLPLSALQLCLLFHWVFLADAKMSLSAAAS